MNGAGTSILYLRQAAGRGGGADRVILNTAGRLNPERFRVHLAYLRNRGNNISQILQELSAHGIESTELAGRRLFDLGQFRSLLGLIRERDVRLLHCHDPKSDVYGRLVKFFLPEIKVVSTLHGWIEGSKKSYLYNRLDRWALRKFEAVIAVSQHNAGVASASGIGRIEVMHNAIDTELWKRSNIQRAGEPSEPFVIGFVGRLSAEKGAIDFVRVARAVLDRDGHCRFTVAGEGPEERGMKEAVGKLGLGEKFRFLGHVEQEELRKLYEGLDVLLLTSLSEGLPMSILEACAMEVCVVAPRVGGIPELITHAINGLLAGPGEIGTLAEHVLTLKSNPHLAQEVRRAAHSIVEEKFSLQANVRRLEELYTRLLCQD